MQYQVAFVASMLIASTVAVGDGITNFDIRTAGKNWSGKCVAATGTNQSPIAVTDENVVKRDTAIPD